MERYRLDGGLVARAAKSRSILAAVSVIQLFLGKAFRRRFWPVARTLTIRSKKSPDGSTSRPLPSAQRLTTGKRWRREVLFRQQSREQACARSRSYGIATPSRGPSTR